MVDFYVKFIAQYTMDLHGSTIGRLTSAELRNSFRGCCCEGDSMKGKLWRIKKQPFFAGFILLCFFMLQSNDEPYMFFCDLGFLGGEM